MGGAGNDTFIIVLFYKFERKKNNFGQFLNIQKQTSDLSGELTGFCKLVSFKVEAKELQLFDVYSCWIYFIFLHCAILPAVSSIIGVRLTVLLMKREDNIYSLATAVSSNTGTIAGQLVELLHRKRWLKAKSSLKELRFTSLLLDMNIADTHLSFCCAFLGCVLAPTF